ncbi:hypothetical protein [Mesorhizobium sp. YR577]|uniref:hypothetical protein n=1 Tax=Mesorhizobium sp. YR577 TaxID=1884373 RepID=UPI0008E2D2AC|nr:hypothetical protein [Mesorhizobium sp. YR577]SFU15538.1 hypothetical protein SAMN05518861_11626 [Mesorhizobium sp. YR577]
MADSDHSMSFACVTRRMALGGGVVAATGWALGGNARARSLAITEGSPISAPDPALALWREWQAAHELAERLHLRQQELEVELAERVDCLCTVINVPDGGDMIICSKAALDRTIGDRTDMAAIRARAEADLAERQARWDAADREIGYSVGLKAEREAEQREESLLKALSVMPATSLAGVAGKLDAVMRRDEAWEDYSKHPWPQILSAREDLVRIGREMAPEQIFPGGSDCPAKLATDAARSG